MYFHTHKTIHYAFTTSCNVLSTESSTLVTCVADYHIVLRTVYVYRAIIIPQKQHLTDQWYQYGCSIMSHMSESSFWIRMENLHKSQSINSRVNFPLQLISHLSDRFSINFMNNHVSVDIYISWSLQVQYHFNLIDGDFFHFQYWSDQSD